MIPSATSTATAKAAAAEQTLDSREKINICISQLVEAVVKLVTETV